MASSFLVTCRSPFLRVQSEAAEGAGYLSTVTGKFIRLAASEAWTSAVTSLALWIAAKARYEAS
jgi:hypothetical protein